MQVANSHKTQDWLRTPLGEALLQQEARVVEEALDGIFGEECLQLGLWGERRTFMRFTRTQRCALIGDTALGEIKGTLKRNDGSTVGSANTLLLSELKPKEAVWINRTQFANLFGDTWTGEASLSVDGPDTLKLLNLNFANKETFFNFSCYEESQ